jgi:hypothetical protein
VRTARERPSPAGKTLRQTPYMPYLSYAPSAWVLPLKFTGGGLSAPGKIMFDGEGNAWRSARQADVPDR